MTSWREVRVQAELDEAAILEQYRALDEISALGIGPDEPHQCDTCGRWLPCRHCGKDT